MKLSDYIIDSLVKQKITHVFGYVGGMAAYLVDSLHGRSDIKFICTYHEQAAAFAAEGYARIKNDIGVTITSSGPGATNLITGIGSAFYDSIPCLYITGQVNTYESKGILKVRQLGFQETDIVSIVKPITKYAVLISDAKEIKYELEKAIHIAKSGRPGPVLMDIPLDIQRAEINLDDLMGYEQDTCFEIDNCNYSDIASSIVNSINSSERPVILVGGGVRLSNATEQLNKFVLHTRIPVVSSLMGLDACDNTLENYCGFIGAYGNRYGNLTLANSDLIITLGSRLDTRQTGTNLDIFAREAKIFRVDIDENELKRKIGKDEICIHANVRNLLECLNMYIDNINIPNLENWINRTKMYKQRYPSFSNENYSYPNKVLNKISESSSEEDIICLDVGQNQMWVAQSFNLKSRQRLLTSGGMGALGFSLPAAIGAYYASPSCNVIAFMGDGGIQMNIQELQLLRRNKIPVKVIILNNHCLGMIRHFQEMYFEARYEGTIQGYSVPDFCKIAEAYGIRTIRIKSYKRLEDITSELPLLEPVIIDVELEQMTYVFPKLAVNRPIEDQEPLLDRAELKDNMIIKPLI